MLLQSTTLQCFLLPKQNVHKRIFFYFIYCQISTKTIKKKVQGCALRKIEGISLVLWICEIQGTQLVISMKKITFPNSPRAKVRCLQGPLRAYKTQPSALIQVKLQNMGSSLVSFAWCNQVNSVSWLSTVYQHPPTPVFLRTRPMKPGSKQIESIQSPL